ncbi:MAG TPA: GNAT family N-acetyltransferase [Caulobacteraceae bacterium]|nr:GNAT family N-acetyltransferase [Caulobacteraceae bacterium]
MAGAARRLAMPLRVDETAAAGRHPYGAEAYAEAIAASQGWTARDVAAWGTGVTIRPAGPNAWDAAGPYPRTPLAADADLGAGLDQLRAAGLVSVVLVPDPLASPLQSALAAAFEVCRPFKTHLLIDRGKGYAPSKHHRDEIRRAQRRCRVEVVPLAERLTDWRALYGALVERRGVAGVAAFPDPYFPVLARSPAFVAFAAFVGDEIAAMTIWFEHAGVAVYHLAAASELGYANGAAYALNDAAIAHFGAAGIVDLGGGAGLADDPGDGLFRFKQGFANARTIAHLCGAVLDPAAYARLCSKRASRTSFFPAYRG